MSFRLSDGLSAPVERESATPLMLQAPTDTARSAAGQRVGAAVMKRPVRSHRAPGGRRVA
ncbi:hypothetical protein L3i23_24440 [Herbiconiux sp. L3-i23]|nr:hypothetical protein L3i23_24440 [Herbiconiux sp. L3-i23]